MLCIMQPPSSEISETHSEVSFIVKILTEQIKRSLNFYNAIITMHLSLIMTEMQW